MDQSREWWEVGAMEQGLPAEIWLIIFSKLAPPELASSCLLVCKSFNKIGNDSSLWHGYFVRQFGTKAKPRHQGLSLRVPAVNWKREYIWRADPRA